MRKVSRGDMFYVIPNSKDKPQGSEQDGYRPCIIVSNDTNNRFSTVVEIVYLTMQDKAELPTHVTITSAPEVSTALCESIHSIDKKRLERYVGHLTEVEMEQVDVACGIGLNFNDMERKFRNFKRDYKKNVKKLEEEIEELRRQLESRRV